MENHLQTFKDNPLTFSMIAIEGGTFDMGSDNSEAFDREKPVHSVSLTDYWMGEYLVIQALWAYVMQDTDMSDPSHFKGQNRPVEQVSWLDITEGFLSQLNKMTKGSRPDGTIYRLPTEAEWEYAAKGGKYWKDFPFRYSGSDKPNEVGWYEGNSHGETKPVGLKTPNLLGLYDMSGNVREWCEDIWHSKYDGAPIDGSAWVDQEDGQHRQHRVFRGGSWYDYAQLFRRLSCRDYGTPVYHGRIIGFRLLLSFPSV